MRWLQNISFSSSSSSSKRVTDFGSRSRKSSKNKELRETKSTKQKKDRDLKEEEVVVVAGGGGGDGGSGGGVGGGSRRSSAQLTESVGLARSQSSKDRLSSPSGSIHHRLSTSNGSARARPLPLPLPLPVPDDQGELKLSPNDKGAEEKERLKLKEKKEREKERDGCRIRDRVDGGSEEVPRTSFSSPLASGSSNGGLRNNNNNRPECWERNSPTNVYQHERISVDSARENFRLDIPFHSALQSAPASPFSSPLLSPPRSSVSEMFQYRTLNGTLNGNQVWSAPEMRIIDPGLPPAFFDYSAISTDSSPFHSPRSRSPCRNNVSTKGSRSKSPHGNPISSNSSSSQNTLHVEVHPLPLPPGAALPSPSSPVPQGPAKPEVLPMQSQWQKGKLIGRGTFGAVFVASNRETGALCAMKEVDLFPDDPKSAECIKQLEQEIKVLSNLKHPNIVQYYGSEIVGDKFYIYLEYVHPGSINKYIRDHCGAMTESIVRNFTRHIVSGLVYLHSKKTIHRDIKGANLLVDASGVVKLADFGMAKHLTGQAADLSLKGSPYWMAPELMMSVMQRDNNSELALVVDIWSLGCTIVEMYTGKPPWSEYEGAAAMFKVMKDTPTIPESLSPEGKDFLRCCFQRNPADRPSASKLLEHPFLKNSLQIDAALSGMSLTDIDQLPASPHTSPKSSFESEGQQQLQQRKPPDIAFASRSSPRSILEALPNASPPRTRYRGLSKEESRFRN